MVGRLIILTITFFIAAFLPIVSSAITGDDLRSMTSDADRNRQESASRAKTKNIGSLVNDKSEANSDTQSDKKAPKRFTKKRASRGVDPDQKNAPSATHNPELNAEYVVPRAGTPAPGQIVSDAVAADIRAYGIRLGTWFEATIDRNISSAEPGLVEITLVSDVIGDKRTLNAGTKLFAEKQFNSATKRLELVVVKGITPRGQEFKMAGLVFDTSKNSGLPGIVNADTDKTIKRGAGKGLLAAAGAAARSVGGSNPVGAAAGAASDSVLQDQSNVVEQTTDQKLTIYVSPQPLLVRVEATF